MNIQQIIKEKYGSDAAFARAIGWTRQKMSRVMRGETDIKVDDIIVFSRELGCTANDVVIFFSDNVTSS